jgi:hypothetical protein
MFLLEFLQKRSRWISAIPPKQRDIEDQLCVDVYCSTQLRLLTVNLDSGLVDGDP